MKYLKAYCLGTALLGVVIVGFYDQAMSGPFPGAHDGSGPSGEAVVAFLLEVASALALLHTAIVVAVFCWASQHAPSSRSDRPARWAAVALLIVVALGAVYPTASARWSEARRDAEFRASPYHRLVSAIVTGTPAEVQKWIAALPATQRHDPYFVGAACVANRLDILKLLQANGFAIAEAGREEAWSSLIRAVVHAEPNPHRGSKVETVTWLVGQGAPFGFSLKASSDALFEFEGPFYRESAETDALFDLLIASGADIQACGSACPLWYAARFQHADHVAILIAHGVDLDTVNASMRTTALGEAIDNGDVAVARLLLDAGAKVMHTAERDDVAAACRSRADSAAELIRALKAAHVRATPEQIDRMQLDDTAQRVCVDGFR